MDLKDTTLVNNSSTNIRRKFLNYGSELTLIIGVTFVFFGLISLFGNSAIYEHILKQELGLSRNSKSFEVWHETPVPMYIEFYFFNWTNPDKLNTEKPAFVEMGPYRFREKHKKVNITWNNNGTVSFKRIRYWHYDAEHSVGELSDNVTTLNAVSLTAAFTVRNWHYILKKSLSLGLTSTGQKMSITKTVNELLFEGYSDTLLNLARKMPAFKGVEIPFDKFGWFYTRNGSDEFDGYFNMETGTERLDKIGKLDTWNFKNHTTFYDDDCSEINGSAGEFWPPNQNRTVPLEMYSPDLCRSISFTYLEDRTVNGIQGLTYILDKELLDNGTHVKENLCYCSGECSPSGVINVTTCHYGAPAFVSYPHFYQADPYYSDLIDGMLPETDKHQFYITIEPNVGIPLDVGARLQVNLLLQPLSGIELYSKAPRVYFPMLWFNQRATMPPDMAASLKLFIMMPTILIGIGWGFIIVGLVISFISLAILYKSNRRRKTASHFTDNIITVQLQANENLELNVKQPLMEEMETTVNKSIPSGQTHRIIA
ncbi:protein croquemort-like [Lycorma delicatula]|uniref:protein croquemort-like n=1 Tax=Lycorma delicatula TaxID=130591 RepID=UPI003F513137